MTWPPGQSEIHHPSVLYTSTQYEEILRREVLRLAAHEPMIIVENLFAKIAIVILSAWIILFPARLFLFSDPEVLWLDAAFAASIGLAAVNAILVAPKISYMLTFLALTFLYSSVKLCRERLRKRPYKFAG